MSHSLDIVYGMVSVNSDEIMEYILLQAPPPRPGLPRPRFSLLLSSHLQYGVVRVYHRQCGIFIGTGCVTGVR